MGFGPRGEHQGPEANVPTQQLKIDRKKLVANTAEDDIDVAAAIKAREEFDAQVPSMEDLQRENDAELAHMAAEHDNRSLRDVGQERAAALAQKLSGGVKSLRGMFGSLGKKLLDAGKGMVFGALAAPEAAGRAGAATKEAAVHVTDVATEKAAAAARATKEAAGRAKDATVRGAKVAGKGIAVAGMATGAAIAAPVVGGAMLAARGGRAALEGAQFVGGKAVEAGQAVKKGAKDVGEIAFYGSIAAGVTAAEMGKTALDRSVGAGKEALRLGNERVVQPAVETAKGAWNGLMERGRNLVDSLTVRKNKAVEGFWKTALSLLERGSSTIDRAKEGVEGKLQRIQGQRQTLELLDSVEPEAQEGEEQDVAASA